MNLFIDKKITYDGAENSCRKNVQWIGLNGPWKVSYSQIRCIAQRDLQTSKESWVFLFRQSS